MTTPEDDDPIGRALGIPPITIDERSTAISSIVRDAFNDSAKEDFTFTRANLKDVIMNATDAIDKLAQIADSSQNPRAFEVLAKLMDTVVNASDKLIETHKKLQDIEKVNEPKNEEAKSVTNNLYVGSTSDLLKVIQGNKNN